MTVEGKSFIVTGGGSGIGAACARLLAESGAAVTICGRTESKLSVVADEIEGSGGRVHPVVADVTAESDVERLVSEAVGTFAAAPVEAIVARYPDVRSLAVYAVPDDAVGDRVMVAVELVDGAEFDGAAFDRFLDDQPDLGTKWRPSFVRVTGELPKLASMKVDKMRLRREAWTAGTVHWRPARGDALRRLTDDDRSALERLLR